MLMSITDEHGNQQQSALCLRRICGVNEGYGQGEKEYMNVMLAQTYQQKFKGKSLGHWYLD